MSTTTGQAIVEAYAEGMRSHYGTVIRASQRMLHYLHARTVARRMVYGSLPFYRRLFVRRPS